jgi:hypothetical protein
MSLFRKFFYRKPPDGLLEITERVYGASPFPFPLSITPFPISHCIPFHFPFVSHRGFHIL